MIELGRNWNILFSYATVDAKEMWGPNIYMYYSFLKVLRIKYRVIKIENINSSNSLKYTNYF